MINRRILRVKVVKNIYAYENCQQANYDLAVEKIDQDFAPDLNSMEPYDKTKKLEDKKKALERFQNFFDEKEVENQGDEEIMASAQNAFDYYKELNKKDFNRIKKEIFKDFEKIRYHQLLILQLLYELGLQNKKIVDEKVELSSKFGQNVTDSTPLFNNVILKEIFNTDEVNDAITREGINWKEEEDKLRDWYKGILRKQDYLKTYLSHNHPDRDEDYQALDDIIRKLVFKHEAIENYFDENDLNWDENKQIVRSLVLKTIKSAKEEKSEIVLPPLSYNWEEDSDYYVDLFVKTTRNNDYYDALIESKVKNWKLERLALMDRVIMKVALCEMINFPSIPVKVTINEFIEISKKYSTPKSKNFINGLLDAISEDLIQAGVIKKSGRGLIDSK